MGNVVAFKLGKNIVTNQRMGRTQLKRYLENVNKKMDRLFG